MEAETSEACFLCARIAVAEAVRFACFGLSHPFVRLKPLGWLPLGCSGWESVCEAVADSVWLRTHWTEKKLKKMEGSVG